MSIIMFTRRNSIDIDLLMKERCLCHSYCTCAVRTYYYCYAVNVFILSDSPTYQR